MGYVIAAILVLMIVGAAVTFFVLGEARKQPQPAEEGHGGVTEPTRGSVPPAGEGGVGGESEGGDPVVPESERLADRGR